MDACYHLPCDDAGNVDVARAAELARAVVNALENLTGTDGSIVPARAPSSRWQNAGHMTDRFETLAVHAGAGPTRRRAPSCRRSR